MTLDFRRNSPPPLISPRDQVRILILLGLMVLVLVAMRAAGRPENWAWMWPPKATPAPQSDSRQPAEGIPTSALSIETAKTTDEPQEYTVPSAESTQTLASDSPTPSKSASEGRSLQLDRSRLATVKDKTRLRLRGEKESGPYYYVLDFARNADPARLEAEARRDVTFAQLFTAPDDYRGELVHLQGVVRRLIQYEAGANEYGIDHLYEAWVFTEVSYNNPYVVVCTRIPDGMPMGNISERVRLAGYFFKDNLYMAGDAPRLAPMILSHRLIWRRPASASAGPGAMRLLLWIIAMGVIAGGTAALVLLLRRRTPSPAERFATASADVLDAIDRIDSAPEPEQFLSQLGCQDAESSDADGQD